jgi:hypothetical protein
MKAKSQDLNKKNLTKQEYQLFSSSQPEKLSKLSWNKLSAAVGKAKNLIDKYRKAKLTASEARSQIINFRIKNLSGIRKRLNETLASAEKTKLGRALKSTKKHPKRMTAQSKRKIDLHQPNKLGFASTEKAKIYDESIIMERKKNSPGEAMSKRIAGFMKTRTRRGQVERDRATTSKVK